VQFPDLGFRSPQREDVVIGASDPGLAGEPGGVETSKPTPSTTQPEDPTGLRDDFLRPPISTTKEPDEALLREPMPLFTLDESVVSELYYRQHLSTLRWVLKELESRYNAYNRLEVLMRRDVCAVQTAIWVRQQEDMWKDDYEDMQTDLPSGESESPGVSAST
jgi:hypothetical protein